MKLFMSGAPTCTVFGTTLLLVPQAVAVMVTIPEPTLVNVAGFPEEVIEAIPGFDDVQLIVPVKGIPLLCNVYVVVPEQIL